MTFRNNANPSKWRSGWPPFTGWWQMPLSHQTSKDVWRWVDVGKRYIFLSAKPSSTEHYVIWCSSKKSNISIHSYHYTDYWPKNARVDRVAPKGLK